MPGGVFREVNLSRLELGGLRRHPIPLLADRPDADGTNQTCGHGVSQILQQAHARPCVLDQDSGRPVLLGEGDDLPAKMGVFEPAPKKVKEIDVVHFSTRQVVQTE